jgi:integrase
MTGCRGFLSSWVQPMGVDAMGLFRQRVTRPIPAGAEVVTKNGKRVAKWRDRTGKTRTADLSDDGKRITTVAATWSARYRDADDVVRIVATGCRDKTAAQTKLLELERTADRIRGGSLSRSDAEVGKWQNIPLSVHVADYIADLRARGLNADRVKTSERYLAKDCDGCGFKWLRDLNADALRKWLRSDSEMGAATYNWHSALWSAFGSWLCGIRLDGRRKSQTGDRRLNSNPFAGFGKKNEQDNRRRIARALTLDEMRRLLDQARRRPLDDALTIRRGPNKGERVANLSPERRAELERLGHERALIYKTLILTGLRKNELRTLAVGDLSFGDVPFLVLRSANEKNRKGSTVPLRGDLAAELREWTRGRSAGDLVFNLPAGLLRILNRDLVAAGIDKIDERDGRVHLHALRHSTGTHLSTAGVSPRTAQAVMRHSNVNLTMNTYTDQSLLDTAGAVGLLPDLPLTGPTQRERTEADTHRDAGDRSRTVTYSVTYEADEVGQTGAISGKIGKVCGAAETGSENEKTPQNTGVLRGFPLVVRAGLEPATPAFSVQGRHDQNAVIYGDSHTVAERLPISLPTAAELDDLAEALRVALDADQRRRLAVELLRE